MAPAAVALARRMGRCLAIPLLAAFVASGAIAEPNLKRAVTLDDLDGVVSGQIAVSSTLDISSDGRWLAVERGGQLWVADTTSGRILHKLGEGLSPGWSPDGSRLAFYSRRSGALQLWVWSRSHGAPRPLTRFGQGVDPDVTTRFMGYVSDAFRFSWSADGNRIVFASRVAVRSAVRPAPGAPLLLNNSTPHEWTLQGVFAQPGGGTGGVIEARNGRDIGFRPPRPGQALYNQLFVVDVQTARSEQLTHSDDSAFNPAWSPDGRSIAFARGGSRQATAVSDGSNVIAATQGEIVILDLQSRRERILAEGDGVKYRPLWSTDASRIVYLVGRSFAAPPNIRIVSLQSGKILDEYTLSGPIVSYDWDRSSSARDFIVSYVGGGEEGASRGTPIAHVRDDSFVISLGSGTPGPWSQARDGTLVWVEGGSAPFVWVSSADQQSARKLLTLTTTDVLAFGKVDTVAWRNSRGEDLNGSLLYPPDYVAGKKYPLIADVYPFPGPKGWMNPLGGNQAWASAGYVVFKPGPRAPHSAPNCSGSASFCEAGRGPGAWDVTVDDVMSGVSDLIRRGLVDADRMCLFGHSNGGGVANYLVTRTDKFKCAVVVAPVLPNWTGTVLLWGDGISLMADLAGAKLWEDPSAYVKLSAIFRADKVKTPMLIADGDNDGSFLLGSIELYNVLRAAGANVTLLRYPDQGHAFTGDALRDFWRREMDFFATYLQAR